MRDICRDARERLNRIATTHAKSFDSAIIHNTLHDRIPEHDGLRHVVDVVERAYVLECREDLPQSVRDSSFDAAETLNDDLEAVTSEVVEEILVDLSDQLDQWDDDRVGWSEDSVAEARDELDDALAEVQD